jgi:quinol monooxygenase YgiN
MSVTYFVRMHALPGKGDAAHEALLANRAAVEREPGNVAFALHRGIDDPDEFWVYETWDSPEAAAAHESSPEFLAYRRRIRRLVDGLTVLWDNAHPCADVTGADRR